MDLSASELAKALVYTLWMLKQRSIEDCNMKNTCWLVQYMTMLPSTSATRTCTTLASCLQVECVIGGLSKSVSAETASDLVRKTE